MNSRERLLAAHLYFDFRWSEWLQYLESGAREDPFRLAIFRSFPGIQVPHSWDEALRISAACSLRRLSRYDPDFPLAIVEHGLDTPVLYIRGNAAIPSARNLLSVVGTRKPSSLGERSAYSFTQFLARRGFGIVSGLARGVDAQAHLAALDEGAFTLAVLGSSHDRLYPFEHQEFAEAILTQDGLLLSEFPPGIETRPSHFPRRNALIAALASGVLVIEAAAKSGAQITAKLALEKGIAVAVLPRDFHLPAGEGAASLIQIGAWPVVSPAEALASFSQNSGGLLQPLDPLPWASNKRGRKSFDLKEYCSNHSCSISEGIAQIQELLSRGVIEAIAPNLYRKKLFTQRKMVAST